jgi:hypothetical protein
MHAPNSPPPATAMRWLIAHTRPHRPAPKRVVYDQAVQLANPHDRSGLAAISGGEHILTCWHQRRQVLAAWARHPSHDRHRRVDRAATGPAAPAPRPHRRYRPGQRTGMPAPGPHRRAELGIEEPPVTMSLPTASHVLDVVAETAATLCDPVVIGPSTDGRTRSQSLAGAPPVSRCCTSNVLWPGTATRLRPTPGCAPPPASRSAPGPTPTCSTALPRWPSCSRRAPTGRPSPRPHPPRCRHRHHHPGSARRREHPHRPRSHPGSTAGRRLPAAGVTARRADP